MTNSEDKNEEKIPFVHSILMAVGENKLTLVEIHERYVRFRPKSVFKKISIPAADLRTVDAYVKALTEHDYLAQEVSDWNSKGKAKIIRYFLDKKGRAVLNGKRK